MIVFIHIPKAAGTSIHNEFKKKYGEDYLFYRGAQDKGSLKDLSRWRAIGGHIWYGRTNKMFKQQGISPKYVTVIREPVERFVSFYNYAINNKSHYIHSHLDGGEDITIEKFVDILKYVGSEELDNLQSKMIYSTLNDYAEIRSRIVSDDYDVDAIYSLPRLEDFVNEIIYSGTDDPLSADQNDEIKIESKNVTDYFYRKDDLTESEMEIIIELNQLDMLLWDRIVSMGGAYKM